MIRSFLFTLIILYNGFSYAGAASSHEEQPAASSSNTPAHEYNLQRLILPIAGDRYLGADPNFHGYVRNPASRFFCLQSSAFEFTLWDSQVEHIGKFKHSKEFKQRANGNLALTFRARFPQLVRTMTLLADHGLLAFDEGFYTIASAALRAAVLLGRDKAINARRIENMPSLPASFNDHCTHIEGLEALPDAAMIAHFYTQFKQLPHQERNLFTTHCETIPTDKKLFKSVDNVQELLRPFMDQVYTQAGPYAALLKKGIDDWHDALQEFQKDIQAIQQTESSRWCKIAALRQLFYAKERKYHIEAPIAVTHRPTQMIDWDVTLQNSDIKITPYYPMNGTLPTYFANKLYTVLDSIVQAEREMDLEYGESSMRPKLAFNEIPSEEVMRLLNHEVFGRPESATEFAVVNIEATLLKFLHGCLTTKIHNTLQSYANNAYISDIRDILANVLEKNIRDELYPVVCVTQQLLDALPLSFLNDLAELLAKTPELDWKDDAMQAYHMERALQEGKSQNFDMYLYVYNHPDEDHPDTAQWTHALPALWHFMELTRDRQKEFLLRMWHEQIKVAFETESFMQLHDCGQYCNKRCWAYASFFYYLVGGKKTWDHNCYPDAMRMIQDKTKQVGWLPEMKDEIGVLHREILQRMYPRYKAILQRRSAKKEAALIELEQERVMQYIQDLDANSCSQLIDRLEQTAQPNLTEAQREALLPIEIRTYLLFSPEKQQEIVQVLRNRYSSLAPFAALPRRVSSFLFGI